VGRAEDSSIRPCAWQVGCGIGHSTIAKTGLEPDCCLVRGFRAVGPRSRPAARRAKDRHNRFAIRADYTEGRTRQDQQRDAHL
jgi:hypothetical protein